MPKDPATIAARVHRGLGIALLAFLAFHAWQLGAAPGGRWAFVERLEGSAIPLALAVALLLPAFLAHAGLGLRSVAAVRRGDAGPYETPAVRGLQIGAGAMLAAFLVFHLAHVFRFRLEGAAAADLYERLRDDLPRPPFALAYLGGATVASLHAAQGVTAAIRRTGVLSGSRARLLERALGATVGAFLFVAFLDVIAWFVTGEALFGGASRGPDGVPP